MKQKQQEQTGMELLVDQLVRHWSAKVHKFMSKTASLTVNMTQQKENIQVSLVAKDGSTTFVASDNGQDLEGAFARAGSKLLQSILRGRKKSVAMMRRRRLKIAAA